MALPALNGTHEQDAPPDTETERVWATLPKSVVAEIDDYHFGQRHKNRSAAVGALIRMGLQAQGWRAKKPDA